MALDEGHYHIYFFCCNNLWKSKFMAVEKPGKLREVFFPYGTVTYSECCMESCVIELLFAVIFSIFF